MYWLVAGLLALGAICGATIRLMVFIGVLVGAAIVGIAVGTALGAGASDTLPAQENCGPTDRSPHRSIISVDRYGCVTTQDARAIEPPGDNGLVPCQQARLSHDRDANGDAQTTIPLRFH